MRGQLFDGTEFSLFAEREKLEFDEEPRENKTVPARIRVVPGAQEGELLLVTLPYPTFENGQTITVRKNQLRDF